MRHELNGKGRSCLDNARTMTGTQASDRDGDLWHYPPWVIYTCEAEIARRPDRIEPVDCKGNW